MKTDHISGMKAGAIIQKILKKNGNWSMKNYQAVWKLLRKHPSTKTGEHAGHGTRYFYDPAVVADIAKNICNNIKISPPEPIPTISRPLFLDHAHMERWNQAIEICNAKYDNGMLKIEFASALIILTATEDLYQKARPGIHTNYLDFTEILNQPLSDGEQLLFQFAGNLYNGIWNSERTPTDILRACYLPLAGVAAGAFLFRVQGH